MDVGAHDGLSLSNSYFLEENLGWTGIAVEPMPHAIENFRAIRSCEAVEGCITGVSGKRKFMIIQGEDMRSALIEPRGWPSLRRSASEEVEIEVECFTLNRLFKDHGLRHVDYLSLDVEGSELEILRSLDFSEISINVIGVESNHYDRRIFDLLSKAGYHFHARLGTDEFYVRKM